jgi:hypothetical protein
VADEYLVEPQEFLPIIELRLDHGSALQGGVGMPHRSKQLVDLARRRRHENAVVKAGVGIDPDYRLTVEIFRYVRDQAVLADRNDDVLGREQEAIEIVPSHRRGTPVARHRRPDVFQNGVKPLMPRFDLIQILTPGAQEKSDLIARGVPCEQKLVVRLARHEYGAGCVRRHGLVSSCWSMILSENRYPLFGIML